jgi:F-type H+-transporting ATPase subunit O
MLHAAARSTRIARPLVRSASSVVAPKYSQALYNAALAASPQTLTKVQTELSTISTTIKSTPAYSNFVSNPALSAADRAAGVKTLITEVSKKGALSDVTKNLLTVLAENGRLGETQAIIDGFSELVSKYKGELEVTITSSSALPKDVLTRLETALKSSQAAQKAKTLKITNKVNSSVMGGIIVDFGDKTIDLSVASRVNKINSLLTQSV